jgi:P4 family phage/plasmid primase-like protien
MFPITLKAVKSSLDGIKLFEVFDKTEAVKLYNSNLLLETPHKHIEKVFKTEGDQIQNYLELSTDIINECKDNKIRYGLVPVKYKRAKGYSFGRVYPVKSLSLCTIRRQVRKSIARHLYKDIDASNAHPEIIYQTCKYHNIECSKLEEYVKNRDAKLKEIMDKYNVNKDDAKLLFIILLYFGSFETWLKSVKLDLKTEPIQFILDFIEDRNRYGKEIEDNNEDILAEIIKSKHKQNKYEYNERASVIAVWCQEIENRILETIYKYCIKKGYIVKKTAVLCYDGIMIEISNYKDCILKEFEDIIKNEFGYKLKYVSKSMDDDFLEVKDINIKEQLKDPLEDFKIFYDELETMSHKHCADIYYKLKHNKYIYSIKTGWYSYNKYNVLEAYDNDFPSGIINNISETLQNYIIRLRNVLMPNYPSYDKHMKHITKLLKDVNNSGYVNGILKYLKELYTSLDIDDKLDNNSNLIAFSDKVYDTKTFKIRDIKKDDYICKTTKYNYDESDPEIRKDILNILQSIYEDDTIVNYYLDLKSKSLFGNTDEMCVIQTGRGGNGKGLLTKLEMKALGDYIKTTENTFLTSEFKQGSANSTLSETKGARTLLISEPSETNDMGKEASLNVAFLKLITGGDVITTRALFKSNISFTPFFTPFILCNDKPNIKKIDGGLMRRLKVIDHPFQFVDNPTKSDERKKDITIKPKFESNIKYAREYLLILLDRIKSVKLKTIEMPQKVKEDTSEYFVENNPVKVYLDAFIEITGDKKDKIKSTTLKDHYDEHSDTKISMPLFIKALKSNGVDSYMSMGYRYFKGIKQPEPKIEQPKQTEPIIEQQEQTEPKKKLVKRII